MAASSRQDAERRRKRWEALVFIFKKQYLSLYTVFMHCPDKNTK